MDCHGPEELLEDVGLLTQLVCLRVGGIKVPADLIGKLTSLQELRTPSVRTRFLLLHFMFEHSSYLIFLCK
jgi:hypothetical protein